MDYKVLIIGLGSMGKRRIRNLRALGIMDIYGYDKEEKTCEEVSRKHKIKIIRDLNGLSKFKFDFAVISTPPQYHLAPIRTCIRNNIPFFSEINLITKDALSITRDIKKTKIVGMPSNTELFDSDVLRLGKIIDMNSKGYFVYQLGQNIHDWHPWQKAKDYFIFNPGTSGIREILRIELPWILNIFGKVDTVQSQSSCIYTKKYGVDDFSCIQLNFTSGIKGILLFDLISPSVIKKFTAVSEKQMVIWEERENIIEIYRHGLNKPRKISLKDKTVVSKYKFSEDAHLEEMKTFLDVITGKLLVRYTFLDEYKLLKIIDKIEKLGKCQNFKKG